jgi:ubiquinone/menaquinone biosynthesis C-methylase UbiE
MKNYKLATSALLAISIFLLFFSHPAQARRARKDKGVNNVVVGLRDAKVRQFCRDLIAYYYGMRNVTEELIDAIFRKLTENDFDDETAAKTVYEEVLYPKNPDTVIARAYNNPQYRQEEAPRQMYGIISQFVNNWGKTVLDVGCGNNALAYAIAESNPGIKEVIGTDVIDYSIKKDDPRVRFMIQTEGDKLPDTIPDGSVDTAVAVFVMHHMSIETRSSLLDDVIRKLKKGGKLIVIEDTFSDEISPVYPSELLNSFLELTLEQRQAVFSFIDWYNNRLIKDKPEMELDYTFANIERWVEIFEGLGLSIERREFLGIVDEPFSPKLPMGIFILTKQ